MHFSDLGFGWQRVQMELGVRGQRARLRVVVAFKHAHAVVQRLQLVCMRCVRVR